MPQKTIQTLADALAFLRWEPKRHGNLLCIAPEKVKRQAQAPLGVPPPDGWMPQDFAAAFGRRVRRFGSLTVIGLDEHVVYTPRPVERRIGEGGVSAFFASLSEPQWQQLCGRGIELGQLSLSQQRLLEWDIPTPLVLLQGTNPTPVSRQERLMGTLTLRKIALLTAKGAVIRDMTVMNPDPSAFSKVQKTSNAQDKPELLQLLPRRPGMGQLNGGELHGTIGLDSPASLTVAGLLARASEEARLNLKADARVANLSVWIRNEAGLVPVRDFLEALCFALGGVFRKTDTGFLLVEDLIPLHQRRARTAEWVEDANRQRWKSPPVSTDFYARLGDPLVKIPFRTNDRLALTTAQVSQYREQQRQGKLPSLAYTALTEGQRTRLDEQLKYDAGLAQQLGKSPVVPETVSIYLSAELRFELPESGSVRLLSLSLPAETARVSLWGRVLLVQATEPEQARSLVTLAQKAGVVALWLDAPPDVIEVALAENSLPIFARVRLLRSAKGVAALNGLGETWSAYCRRRFRREEENWLDPGVASNLPVVLQQVRAVAALPGLAGLVLADTVPPGFREDWTGCQTSLLGFTPERCRAFLKKQSIDPTDVLPEYGDTFHEENEGRVFTPAHSLADDWLEERQDESKKFLGSLQQALHSEWPGLTIWWGGGERWLVRGNPKKPLPELYPYSSGTYEGYEREWLVPLDKLAGAQTSRGVLDTTMLTLEKIKTGLRAGEF